MTGEAHPEARCAEAATPHPPHALDVTDVEASLRTRHSGLSREEVATRLAVCGPNQLPQPPATSRGTVLLHQVKSPLIYILVIATCVTLLITVLAAARAMAQKGLRVLATAYGDAARKSHGPQEVDEPAGLCFVGLVGMMDPPREGVREAILGCQAAGMRVVMITGDHAETALAIGEQLGIAQPRSTPTQFVLRVEPLLEWQTWGRMIAVGASILVAIELHKLLRGGSRKLQLGRTTAERPA